MMALTRGNRPRSISTLKTNGNAKANANGSLNSQQAIFDLKQRVLLVLNKLADRDTYHIASEELGRIAENLTPEGFGPFLSCIFETDSQQKNTVRRECVKIFGTLAGFHGELLAPHLPKMVGNIIRRLKDPDSNVRDACVDAVGVLASKIMHRSGNSGVENGGTFSVFAKPLFEALGEQNRQLQVGSALCLARVIDNAGDPPVSTLQRFLPRIIKLLNNQSFLANAALLSVIGSIIQAGGASTQQMLAVLVPCMIETLQSSDWTTRKAAAEAFACMALSLGSLLTPFKSSCLAALEACRFDKVKPVRDAVVQTLQAWRSIPDLDSPLPLTESGDSVKENLCEEGLSVDLKSVTAMGRKSSFLRKSGTDVTKSATDRNSVSSMKKRVPLMDKKTNPSLSWRLDHKKMDDWHIEVAVPRTCPASIPVICDEEFNDSYGTKVSARNERASKTYHEMRHGDAETFGKTEPSRLSDETRASFETKCILVDKSLGGNSSTGTTPTSKPTAELAAMKATNGIRVDRPFGGNSSTDTTPSSKATTEMTTNSGNSQEQSNRDNQCSDSLATHISTGRSMNLADGRNSHSVNDLAFIRKQLFQIENQQSNLLELLQVFMGSSLESICSLETRVHGLERIVKEMAQDLSRTTGRLSCMESGNKCCRFCCTEIPRSMHWKKNEILLRPTPSDTVLSKGRFGEEALCQAEFGRTDAWEDHRHGPMQSGFVVNPLIDIRGTSCQEYPNPPSKSIRWSTSDNTEVNPIQHRSLDTGAWKDGFLKWSSARRVWKASKDELSLSATQFEGEDTQTELLETRKGNSKPYPQGMSSISASYESGHFWSVWTHAIEYLRTGDVDSAFVEVLCSGDDLLLIQLMKRTGPVLESLSQGTIFEILQTIIGLLLEQKFFETIIPWLQQVVELTISNGPDYLGLSPEARMDILSALQEASSMHFSDLSSRRCLTQLASKLVNAWAAD